MTKIHSGLLVKMGRHLSNRKEAPILGVSHTDKLLLSLKPILFCKFN